MDLGVVSRESGPEMEETPSPSAQPQPDVLTVSLRCLESHRGMFIANCPSNDVRVMGKMPPFSSAAPAHSSSSPVPVSADPTPPGNFLLQYLEFC
jgi:hypothetical protein